MHSRATDHAHQRPESVIAGPYVLDQDPFTPPTIVRRNRRAHPRLAADQLGWLEGVRFPSGPSVSLIDLSMHGAFFEVDRRLRPGEATNFELLAADRRAVVTGHILRTEVVALSAAAVRYRGACAFDRPLPWSRRLSVPAPPPALPVSEPTDYQPWHGWSEIRLSFRHGQRLQGYTRGFHPLESFLHLWSSCDASNRARQTVPLSLLRTVAFVRDLDDEGKPQRSHSPESRALHPVEVTFRNNDVVRGATPGYESGQVGFWILPWHKTEQARVFALSSAVREICFL
jgi:hypothetical protein